SLRHAVLWFAVAWFGWLVAFLASALAVSAPPVRYLALCLSACALVAVLGARQPGMAAWNFVVGGLLAIFLLPLMEQPWNSPTGQLDDSRTLFLASILALGIVNYVPTRWMLAALAAVAWTGTELWRLSQQSQAGPSAVMAVLFAALVWLAFTRKSPN